MSKQTRRNHSSTFKASCTGGLDRETAPWRNSVHFGVPKADTTVEAADASGGSRCVRDNKTAKQRIQSTP